MRKHWMVAAVFAIAISTTACGSKAVVDEPRQQAQEPAKPEVEASNPEQAKPDDNEKSSGSIESPAAEEGAFRIPEFSSKDFDGNEITNDFFADNILTIVNVWTTT